MLGMRRISIHGTAWMVIMVAASSASISAEHPSVTSPDGRVGFELLVGERILGYRVTWDGKPIVDDSPLGIIFADGEELGPGMRVRESETDTVDETWEPVYGKTKTIRDHHNLLKVTLQEPARFGRRLGIHVRAYDDGVAFRYAVPEQGPPDKEWNIADELTAFHVTADAKAFAHVVDGFSSAYESNYTVGPLSTLTGKLICLPYLLEIPDGPWTAITEANLTNYAGMYVTSDSGAPLNLTTRLAPSPKKDGVAVHATLPIVTPWRVILLGDQPGDLIESNLILSCNDPCAIEDVSWIEPGMCVWDWWNGRMVSGVDFEGGINTETMLHLAEFAAEAGFGYLLIDDGWSKGTILEPIPELDLPRILEYCKARGVKVLLWMHWTLCDKEMEEAFPLYEKWGVAGVKIDFMNNDHEDMVDFYHRTTQLAAKHRLLVDFHGAYKPTGIRRTWPNLITREGVRGEEHSKWSRDITPQHNVTIPFTRMLAGPMDYTPGGFDNWHESEFEPRGLAPRVMGTRAHNLAKFVVYESPLQMCVDYPANYRGQPGFDFLQLVPTTWDETFVVSGYPGDSIAMARKHGENWYVGIMIGGGEGRKVEIPLGFLGEGEFRVRVWEDGRRADQVATQLRVYEQDVSAADALVLHTVSGGGAVARIVPREAKCPGLTHLRHLVGFRWKESTTEEQRKAAMDVLRSLPGKVPEIIEAEFGPDVSGRGKHRGFTDHILFTFRDTEALQRYQNHPAHQQFVKEYLPLTDDVLVLDWPVRVDRD